MARNTQDAYRDSVMFAAFVGLRNTAASKRLAAPRVGKLAEPVELEAAVNIDIDNELMIRRRRGQTLAVAGDFHSAWTGDNNTFVVADGALSVLYPDFTTATILSGIGTTRLAYLQIADTVYFSGENVSGKILPDLSYTPWGTTDATGEWVSPVTRPTQYVGEIQGRRLTAPPHAEYLAETNGRIYLAQDDVLWATEFMLYDHVDATKNYMQFESKITGLGTVEGGMYVGTMSGTYFLSGPLSEMSRTEVDTYQTIPRSMISVDAEVLGEDKKGKTAIMYMTDNGLCAGLDGGSAYNLTKKRAIFPGATSVAALFREQDGINQYIGVTDTGGTPSSKARIGDYVDAEIRRFQGA